MIHSSPSARRCWLLAPVLCGLSVAPGFAQQAANITVTSLADSGGGTLRDALERARTDGAPTVIRFGVGGDIFLQTTLPPIGDLQHGTTIDGSTAPSRVRIRTAPGGYGVALFVFAPNNVFRSFDLHDVENDVCNLYETSDGNLFEDVAITNCRRGIGLLINGSDRNRFLRCRFENNASSGIYCRDGSDFNQFGPGMRLTGNATGGLHLRASHGNVVLGTASEPVEIHSNGLFGIALFGGATQNVVGPEVRITGGSGFAVRITDPITSGNVLQGVSVTGFSGPAFLISLGTHHNLLWRCVADGPSGSCFLVNSRASQNILLECTAIGRAGIGGGIVSFSDAPNNRMLACTLAGRGVAGSTLNVYGMTIARSRSCEVADCDFTNFQSHGIAVNEGGDYCFLQRNRVHASGGRAPNAGIGVQGVSGAPVVGALLMDNTVENNSQVGLSFGHVVDGALVGNTVRGATNTGILVMGGTQRIDLRDNSVEGPSSAPTAINLYGARDVRLFGNTLRGFTDGVAAPGHNGPLVCDGNRFIDSGRIALNLGGIAATVTNNLFDANDIGVSVNNAVLPGTRLVNNTFVHNRIGHQGGGEIWNSVFWFNTQDLLPISFTFANLRNNDLQTGNPRVGSNGNISAVPPFVAPASITGNFRLQNVTSPLIQGGSAAAPGLPEGDFDGQARILGSAPDMGLDEVR